ncbi:hypothetical protein IMCC14465_07350 [alpha proteobacterium IMCC14465]|uniref:Cytidylate kinase n=1 Tax=alpha proteobacterium IMCC14465 TaxID=1220535 RepID=J9DZ24_9PROT|nr:hypothetical protein IMCC14465_07350 [alpha proteobacterium IMCC14465]
MSHPSPIAIDGPAAAGKGTLAKKLGAYLNYACLDTGALYRGVALLVLHAQADPTDPHASLNAAQKLDIDAIDQTAIRSAEVGQAAADVAVHPEVRNCILELQRHFAANPPAGKDGAILDGRDIGTFVCPDAPVKLFVTASAEIRAHRRWLELSASDKTLKEADILAAVIARDKKDMERAIAPLRPAEDAHLLDTSDLGIESAFEAALKLIVSIGS